ncbi:cytochrome P450 family protein [Streptomyces kronopolitis]|uniref:cytochrome P450 family protein n=1 Tax=Streptomyces kronopolitis TaxID=1612435 RepID=UPI0036C68BBB
MPHEPELLVLDARGADPDAEIRALHARGPASRIDILGVTAWSVSEPTLLKRLLSSPDVSKDARQHWPRFSEVGGTWPLALWVSVKNMFTAYGGEHRRLRRLVAPAFAPRRVAALTGTVEALVSGLLDGLAATAPGETVDLRERFAYPLPIQVISHLMGLPADQREGFRGVVDGVFATTLTPEEAAANTARLYAVLDRLIATGRAAPGEDMTSLLISARDEEGGQAGLSDEELRDTLLLMVSAGYETTVNLIDQAVTALLTHPDQLALVRAGRAGWADVVEETLRLRPAIKHLPLRFAVRDIPLPDGQVIAAGEAILASYAAANRHPGRPGERTGVFDLTRTAPGPEHLAFGHGAHYCLGAPLARLEAVTALRALFARFPGIELAVCARELELVPSLITYGHRHLPVPLRPAG